MGIKASPLESDIPRGLVDDLGMNEFVQAFSAAWHHKKLDEAVFSAYGWKSDLTDEEILEKLSALVLRYFPLGF